MSVAIFDIDNCIADDSWRIPRINWKIDDLFYRYHDYHSLSLIDLHENSSVLNKHAGSGDDIVLFTARPIAYSAITEEWLHLCGIKYKHLVMRGRFDTCHSAELKGKQLELLIANCEIEKRDIVCAYDDRPDVIEMYKTHGINAEILSIHDICAYTQPKTEEEG